MKELSSRTAGFTDSVIRRMTRISNRYGAVNLSQGFPDFDLSLIHISVFLRCVMILLMAEELPFFRERGLILILKK